MVNCKHDKGFYVKVRGSVVDYYNNSVVLGKYCYVCGAKMDGKDWSDGN